MLMLLLNGAFVSGGTPEPPAPPVETAQHYSGGYLYESREDRKERIRRDRIAFGIIPDDVPKKAIEIIEVAVVEEFEKLGDEDEAVEELKAAFREERERWKDAYGRYFKEYMDMLRTAELRSFYQRRKKRKLMMFVLLNS